MQSAPARQEEQAASEAPIANEDVDSAAVPVTLAAAPITSANSNRKFTWPPVERMAMWGYFLVAGALMLRLLLGVIAALRLWASAGAVSPLYAPHGNVRASAKIASPVTIGSGVVLPADYRQWERSRLRTVLAHEQSHVQQMDFYLQLLAGLYTAAFWFSPLGWWLRRTLTRLGEAISDRAGMEAAESTTEYAQIVLEFAAMPRRNAPGVAMARPGNLSQRIEALLSEGWLRSAFAEGRRKALASLVVVPAALFAATALIRVPVAAAQTAPAQTTATPAVAGASAAQSLQSGAQNTAAGLGTTSGPGMASAPGLATTPGVAAGDAARTGQVPQMPPQSAAPKPPAVPQGADEGVAPQAAAPPVPPMPPVAEIGSVAEQADGPETTVNVSHGHGSQSSDFDYHSFDNGDAWVVASGTWNEANLPANLSASRRAEIERAHQMAHGPFLWFTQGGKSYVVTDPAQIGRMEGMYEAMSTLGREQGELGRQQGALGREQGQLGREQGQIGRGDWQIKLPDMAQVDAQIEAAMARTQAEESRWNAETMARVQAEMKNAQVELSPEKMAEIQAKIKEAENWWTPERQAELREKLQEANQQIAEAEKRAADQQAQWSTRMSEAQEKLGEAQGQLGEAQGRLGEIQGRLGEAQGRLQQGIDREVQRIIQQSLASGRAVPVQ